MNFEKIIQELESKFAHSALQFTEANGELTVTVAEDHLLDVCKHLKDDPEFMFKMLVDACGVDYSTYGEADFVHDKSGELESPFTKRYAAVYHLLSLEHNMRVRLRAFAHDDENPQLPSVVGLWAGANWFEREAYDLYGIEFYAHPDLRRILTDYDFEEHPMRKDFPTHGRTEVVYDESKDKVVQKPCTYKFRRVVPRVIRR